jgi:hypothetical protein
MLLHRFSDERTAVKISAYRPHALIAASLIGPLAMSVTLVAGALSQDARYSAGDAASWISYTSSRIAASVPRYAIVDPPPADSACTDMLAQEQLAALGGVDPASMTDAQINALIASLPRPYGC